MNYLHKQKRKYQGLVIVFSMLVVIGIFWSIIWYFSTEQWRGLDLVTFALLMTGIIIGLIVPWAYSKIFFVPDQWIEKLYSYSKGIRGEDLVIQKLESLLSDKYIIIPSVVVSEYGDTDIITVGPKGIIAIEVKNWSDPILIKDGVIWRQKKNGNLQERVTSDPFNQIKGQVGSIAKFLAQHDLPCDHITPIVVFAGKDVKWEGKNPTLLCHVNHLKDALGYIKDADENFMNRRNEIVELLQKQSMI